MAKRSRRKEELTLSLHGDVSVSEFARAAAAFDSILRGLNEEVAPKITVDWLVSGLNAGSASQSAMPIADTLEVEAAAKDIAEAWEETGDALESRRPIPFKSKLVNDGAETVRSLVRGKIIRAVFASPRIDYIVAGPAPANSAGMTHHSAYGALRGNVMAIGGKDSLRFVLYELSDEHAVQCFVGSSPTAIEELRKCWRNGIVEVEGHIRRDAFDGEPISIRDVQRIQLVNPTHYDWSAPIGALEGFLGDESSESIVRRNRDER